MVLFERRWVWVCVVALAALILLIISGMRKLDEADKEFKESKWVRTTTGTVLRKELFRCQEPTCIYVGYGGRAEIQRGVSQQRVYFQIDNFDQVGEPRLSRAIQSEKELVRANGPRSTSEVDWYDRVITGDKLSVRYQCFSDGRIEIVGIDAKPVF
jgi:hypothetical protein